MKAKTPRTNWILDAVLFGGFLLTFFLNLTGVEFHQWLGIAAGVLAGYHLTVHWNWIKAVLRRLWQGADHGPWLNAILDAIVMLGLLGILVSGLVISTWLNLSLSNYEAWHSLHVVASVGTLVAVVVKLAIHWRWILAVARKFGKSRVQTEIPVRPEATTQPLTIKAEVSNSRPYTRREFVKLMGGVSLVALLAAANVLDDVQATTTSTTGSTASSSTSTSRRSRTSTTSSSSSSSSGCQVQCNRGCSFPGHCRRYVDTNNNNRCDLSECLSS